MTQRRRAPQGPLSVFSSEKETKEPWHPPPASLGDDMMDPDPEGGSRTGRRRIEGGGGNRDVDDKEETNASRSIVIFYSK